MDPLSQAALGATAGHALCHRRLGARAVGLGAVAGAFPDIDAFYGLFVGPFGTLVSHRGVTHSLFFGPVVGLLFGWLWWRFERRRSLPGQAEPDLGDWVCLFVVALMSHPLLDWFTTFGTQLLAPFSRARFALDAVAVVDPVYTVILVVGLAVALRAGRRRHAGFMTGAALLLSTVYLFFGLALNGTAESEARRQLRDAGIDAVEVRAYPTMFQLPHRRVVALTRDEIRVGFVSAWRPCEIEWGIAPRLSDTRVDAVLATREGRIYAWFANGLLAAAIENDGDGDRVRLVDLRYGYVPDPLQGMWGIVTRFDADGRMRGRPQRYNSRPRLTGEFVRGLFAAGFAATCPAGT
jgi:inner membrane protein